MLIGSDDFTIDDIADTAFSVSYSLGYEIDFLETTAREGFTWGANQGSAGGFVLYPSKINNNFSEAIYSK